MTSCSIIISHYESIEFLHCCIRQIRKYIHPGIEQHIIVVDQSGKEIFDKVILAYADDEDITIVHTLPYYSGYGIDYVMRNVPIKSEYICQLHVDAMPINQNWLYLPIQLIKEMNFSFVGQLQFISQPTDTIYYLKNMFCAMAQCFNVARTETYLELSMEAGFTRFHERTKIDFTFNNDDWGNWAAADYDARGTDDDVVAFCWEDNHRQHNKLGLSITGMMGKPEDGASFGRIIEDIIFHFGSCRESIGVFGSMPEAYQRWTRRINAGFGEDLLEEMLEQVKPHLSERVFWNGIIKKASSPVLLSNKIEHLKNGVEQRGNFSIPD